MTSELDMDLLNGNVIDPNLTRKRRTRIPAKPNQSFSLWSVIKNLIGKDLTKIPLPVYFNEPLSMLQRTTEEFEYSELLDKAAIINDVSEQLTYVAAFLVSGLAASNERTTKPFNPLQGETYECDRTADYGWRCITEQVSHHPPVLAQYCEGRGWRAWRDMQLLSKFHGRHLQVSQIGLMRIEFTGTQTSYSFRRVPTYAHNIVMGRMFVAHSGDMEITGEKKATGYRCSMSFSEYSYFLRTSDYRSVTATVYNAQNQPKFLLNGHWHAAIDVVPVLGKIDGNNRRLKTGPKRNIWKRNCLPDDSHLYYNFSELTCQLNEMETNIAPTDSRCRPDQRLMENGYWDASNNEKLRLEENQRQRLKMNGSEPRSVWFRKVQNDRGGVNLSYEYCNKYWQCKDTQNWSECPSIF